MQMIVIVHHQVVKKLQILRAKRFLALKITSTSIHRNAYALSFFSLTLIGKGMWECGYH